MRTTLYIFTLLIFSISGQVSADEIYQKDAADLCQELKQTTYRSKCMETIKGNKYNIKALSYCKSLNSWNKARDCLPLIANKNFESKPLTICLSSKYFNKELKDCVLDISNKSYISDIEIELCTNEKYYSKQVKCLKGVTTKPYEEKPIEKPTSLSKEEIQENVKEAYSLLKQEKSTAATLLLHDLVKEFEKE